MPSVTFPSFRLTAQTHLSNYLGKHARSINSGALTPPNGFVYLFPTVIVFTRTPTHYCFELFGARRKHQNPKSKLHEASSFNVLLGDFAYDGPTAYIIAFERGPGRDGPRTLSNAALTGKRTIDALESRFPGVMDLYPSKLYRITSDEIECIKAIDGSNLNGALLIDNCLIGNSLGSLIRARYTNLFLAVPANMEPQEMSRALGELVVARPDHLPGVQLVRQGHQESVAQAGQFANLYLQGMQETTLTQFLEDHADIITYALDAEEVYFQPSLLWYEGNPDPDEEAIQPDIIAHRKDGTWLIIDFKLPLLNKPSITTGGHRRRRFAYTTADGIAQLHNYREFFDYDSNSRNAMSKLRGQVVSDPQLMLVVGTSENVNLTEVNEAMRALKPIDIVDYDTLIRLSIAKRDS